MIDALICTDQSKGRPLATQGGDEAQFAPYQLVYEHAPSIQVSLHHQVKRA